jgi:CubicO group peptidase (beta-lactamase class C family)
MPGGGCGNSQGSKRTAGSPKGVLAKVARSSAAVYISNRRAICKTAQLKEETMKTTRWLALVGLFALGLLVTLFAQAQGDGQATRVNLNKAVAELEKQVREQVDTGGLPGVAIAVVHQGNVVYAKGFGVREMGKSDKVDADTVFQLASVSKPISASVVAALIGDGKITWDSKLNDIDPAFEMYDPYVTREITIRDMYSHRSGLPAHAGDKLEDLGYSRAQVLHNLRYQRPGSRFRSQFAYTNFGITEGSVAAAGVYGLDWADASEQKLYKQLGMNSTSSRFKDFEARANKAVNHVLRDGKWMHQSQRNPDAQSPAGGVSSSANDMAKWMRMQVEQGKFEGKPIVAAAPLAETQFPQMITGVNRMTGMPTFSGLGWNVNYDAERRVWLTHSGAFALGAATNVILVPAEQLGIVVLTNGEPIGVAEGLAQIFIDNALYGKPTLDWMTLYKQAFKNPETIGLEKYADYSKPPSPGTPAMKNQAYIGTYGDNTLVGDIQIIERGGKLALVIGPQKMTLPLAHYDRDTFTYETVGENAAGLAGVTFTMDADGNAMSVVIENLNVQGQGSFNRVDAEK